MQYVRENEQFWACPCLKVLCWQCKRWRCPGSLVASFYIRHFYDFNKSINQFISFSSKWSIPVVALLFLLPLQRLLLDVCGSAWSPRGSEQEGERGSEFGTGSGLDSKVARVKAWGPPPIINTSSVTIWKHTQTQYSKVLNSLQIQVLEWVVLSKPAL